MTIDIIDLTDPKYADLNAVQLAMVRAAQAEKNKAVAHCEEEIKELFYYFLGRNTARASALSEETEQLRTERDEEVERIREDLLYRLATEALGNEGNEYGPYRYPENPNYGLSYSQRFLIVREYYMSMAGDAASRLEAYRLDTLARTYLGDFYATLYDLLASYVH